MLKFNLNLLKQIKFKKRNKIITKLIRTTHVPASIEQKKLVNRLAIQNDEIRFVMDTTDRINFYNNGMNDQVYKCKPISVGYNTTMSSPHVHAFQLDTLMDALKEDGKTIHGMNILDIGCGTGYLTACLAKLVGHAGNIYAIDHVRKFVDELPNNFSKCNIPTSNLYIEYGDGINGYFASWKKVRFDEYFDVIIVGGSLPFVPLKIFKQLKVNGIIIGPQGIGYDDQIYYVLKKTDKNNYIKNTITDSLVFAPLIELDYQLSHEYLLKPFKYSDRILNNTEMLSEFL